MPVTNIAFILTMIQVRIMFALKGLYGLLMPFMVVPQGRWECHPRQQNQQGYRYGALENHDYKSNDQPINQVCQLAIFA